MRYRKLGKTDLNISVIGLGTMTWGNQNTEGEGHQQMDYALEQGINFFDTAEMYAVPPAPETYGTTETIIGSWFAKNKNRDKVILGSKIAGPGLSWVRNGEGITGKTFQIALEDSLRRLQTDYIDLYQIHWPERGGYQFGRHWNYTPQFDKKSVQENFLDILETAQDLIKQGKIRHLGLSNETCWGTSQWLQLSERHNLPRIQSIQNEYSLLYRPFDTDLHELSMAEECGLLAWSPLTRGMISGKYIDGARPPGTRLTIETRPEFRDTPLCNEAVKAYIKVAEKNGLDICQMALAFVNDRPFVTSNLIGATNMEQLKSNIASIDLTLDQDVLDDIEKVHKKYPIPY